MEETLLETCDEELAMEMVDCQKVRLTEWRLLDIGLRVGAGVDLRQEISHQKILEIKVKVM